MSTTRERALGATFAALAGDLVADVDLLGFLRTLSERSGPLLGVDAVGVTLADRWGRLHLAAASPESSLLLELFDTGAQQGPCVEAYRIGQAVLAADLADEGDASGGARWPHFAAHATGQGFHGAHGLPLRAPRRVVGALTLLSRQPYRPDEQSRALAQTFADVATVGLLQQCVPAEDGMLAEQLQRAVDRRARIEQAVGWLAQQHDLSPERTHVLLREAAARRGEAVADLADAVVRREVVLGPS